MSRIEDALRRDIPLHVAAEYFSMVKQARELTMKGREQIKEKNFAIPKGDGPGDTGKYPIHDERHAKTALTYVEQHGTPAEKAKVYSAVAKKYPGLSRESSVPALREKAQEKKAAEEKKAPIKTMHPGISAAIGAGGGQGVPDLAAAAYQKMKGKSVRGAGVKSRLVGGAIGAATLGAAGLAARRQEKKHQKQEKTAADESDSELREKGRQRAVSSMAAEFEREKSRRAERAGGALGALGGAAAGALAGKKLVGGKLGTLGGAALGLTTGRQAGKEVGTEVDIKRHEKTAALRFDEAAEAQLRPIEADTRKGMGKLFRDAGIVRGAVPSALVSGLGSAALTAGMGGGLRGAGRAAGAGALGGLVLGGLGGALAGQAKGQEAAERLNEMRRNAVLGRAIQQQAAAPPPEAVQEPVKAAAARMKFKLAATKLADDGAMGQEAPMTSPTAPELQPQNYLAAEQIGQQAQDATEMAYYKEQARQAQQQAAMASQQAEATAAASAEGQAQAQQLQQQAMMAQDEATKQTQVAAQLRIALQAQRAKLMDVVSQDPTEALAAEIGQGPAPAVPPGAEEAGAAAGAPPPPEAGMPQPPPSAAAAKEMEEAARAQNDAAEQTAQAEGAAQGGPAAAPPPGGPAGPPGAAPPAGP